MHMSAVYLSAIVSVMEKRDLVEQISPYSLSRVDPTVNIKVYKRPPKPFLNLLIH